MTYFLLYRFIISWEIPPPTETLPIGGWWFTFPGKSSVSRVGFLKSGGFFDPEKNKGVWHQPKEFFTIFLGKFCDFVAANSLHYFFGEKNVIFVVAYYNDSPKNGYHSMIPDWIHVFATLNVILSKVHTDSRHSRCIVWNTEITIHRLLVCTCIFLFINIYVYYTYIHMYIDKIPQTEHKLGVSVSLPTLSRTAKRGPSPYCPPSFKSPPPKKKKKTQLASHRASLLIQFPTKGIGCLVLRLLKEDTIQVVVQFNGECWYYICVCFLRS